MHVQGMANANRRQIIDIDLDTESDIIDLFGPLEDSRPPSRHVRAPRLGCPFALCNAPSKSENNMRLSALIEHTMPNSMTNEPMDQIGVCQTMQSTLRMFPQFEESQIYALQAPEMSSPYRQTSTSCATPALLYASLQNTCHHDMIIMSPLRKQFVNDQSAVSLPSNVHQDSEPQAAASSCCTLLPFSTDRVCAPRKLPIVSMEQDGESSGPNDMVHALTGRRHRTTPGPANTAREAYLEKNRKAANKCRFKQKKQQEVLVETARDAERKNKMLKAEVELLQGDLRSLKQMVGEHIQCPDARLRIYVQHEADHIAAGDAQNPSIDASTGQHNSSPDTERCLAR